MKWFRFYSGVLHDAKVQTLPAGMFRAWINVLCIANEGPERGMIPETRQVAFALRVKEEQARAILDQLTDYGLIDRDEAGNLRPHNWSKWQRDSDDVNRRVRHHRQRNRDGTGNGPVTLQATNGQRDAKRRGNCRVRPDSDSDTDSDSDPPPLPPGTGGGGGTLHFVSEEHRETVELARSLVDDDFAAIVAFDGRDIAEQLGGRWDCYRAAVRALARSTPKENPHGWCLTVAAKFRLKGIPPEPSGKGRRGVDPYARILAELDDE